MVPQDRPQQALLMIKSFLDGTTSSDAAIDYIVRRNGRQRNPEQEYEVLVSFIVLHESILGFDSALYYYYLRLREEEVKRERPAQTLTVVALLSYLEATDACYRFFSRAGNASLGGILKKGKWLLVLLVMR
eukprot:g9539.t1